MTMQVVAEGKLLLKQKYGPSDALCHRIDLAWKTGCYMLVSIVRMLCSLILERLCETRLTSFKWSSIDLEEDEMHELENEFAGKMR
jgi:hypothetical protein